MASSFTTRPISSVRDQAVSPTSSNLSDSPAIAIQSYKPYGKAYNRSPLLEDRQSSPDAASLRSSDPSLDQNSVYSVGRRSTSTALTPVSIENDRVPSSDPRHTYALDRSSHKMSAIDKAELAAHRSPPPSAPAIRRPTSPAGRVSNHSAEWDMHSDRGSPRIASARPSARVVPSSNAHPAYAAEYSSGPMGSAARDPYRDNIHPSFVREQDAASPSLNGVKRKVSGPEDTGRRASISRVDRSSRPWPEEQRVARDYYPESSYYRGRERKVSPDHGYPKAYPPHESSSYAAPRYQTMEDDPRYSPRRAFPASPSGRGEYPRGSQPPYRTSYGDRRSGRYSPGPPVRSPPYSSRNAPPMHASHNDPYARVPPHAYAPRPSSPPYGADLRPQLPPLSARPPPPVAADNNGRSRYTPPRDAAHHHARSRSPEIQAYPEPYYPDRRLFFARDRIQDPEIDEYYHSAAGSQRKKEYPYDAYAAPHAPAYTNGPPPGLKGSSNGMMMSSAGGPVPPPSATSHAAMRHPSDARSGYPVPYGAPEYMSDPRDPHAHMRHNSRPGPTYASALVPPGPSTGIAPPPRRRGKLPKPVTDLLKSWLLEHAGHPYPTEDEKRTLCSMTGLTLSQVSNWFINARRRILLPSGSNGSPGGSSTAAQVKAAFGTDSLSPEP